MLGAELDETALPYSATAARSGRAIVRTFCRTHDVPAATADDAILITGELISNAFLHARSGTRLRLSYQQRLLRVEVTDGSRTEPVLGRGQPNDSNGRGVLIMDTLAQRWGVRPHSDGKTVWFELDL